MKEENWNNEKTQTRLETKSNKCHFGDGPEKVIEYYDFIKTRLQEQWLSHECYRNLSEEETKK